MAGFDPYETGYARAVAPAWQPLMMLGAEVAPVSAVLILGFVMCVFVQSWPIRIGIFAVVGVLIGLLQYLGKLDNRYWAGTLGFPDRGEYVASATVDEYDRETNPKMFGIL